MYISRQEALAELKKELKKLNLSKEVRDILLYIADDVRDAGYDLGLEAAAVLVSGRGYSKLAKDIRALINNDE